MYFIIPLVSGGEEDIGDFPLDCLGCCSLDFPCVASDVGMVLSDETAGSFAQGPLTSSFCSAEDRDGFFVETDEQAPGVSGISSAFDAG